MTRREELIQDILDIYHELKYIPSFKEYRKSGGRFSRKPFRTTFGSWGEAINEVKDILSGESKEFKLPKYDDKIRVDDSMVIVAFDAHVPYHDKKVWKECFRVARLLGINSIILGGDTTDFKALYSKEPQDADIPWAKELRKTKEFMNEILDHFDKIYWFRGNHEWRLSRLLKSNEAAREVFEMLFESPQVIISDKFYCQVGNWLLVNHPTKSRKNKVSLAEDLCKRYRMSILNGHTHRFMFAVDDSGQDIIGEGLHMTIPTAHEYKYRDLNTHSEWVQGFWIVDNKNKTVYPYVIHPKVLNLLRDEG